MSEEIKKEAQDAELNPEELDTVAGGGYFDILPHKVCSSCKRTLTVDEVETMVDKKCPYCGGTVVDYTIIVS